MDRNRLGRVKQEDISLETGEAVIDGDVYPMFYAKLINLIHDQQRPLVYILGEPGTGKSYAAARIGYDLHNKVGFFEGKFTPENNIHFDNLEFLKAVRTGGRYKVQVKEEVDATLNALDYAKIENRKNGNVIGLSRILKSPLIYVGQYMNRGDKDIRDLHTIRIVADGSSKQYRFKVYYINRDPDNPREDFEKIPLHSGRTAWKPDKPPEKFCRFLQSKDENWKMDRLETDIREVEAERSEKDKDKLEVVA